MSNNLDFLNNLKIKYNPNAEQINGIYVNLNNKNIDKVEFDQSKRDIFIDRLMTIGALKVTHDNDEATDDKIKNELKDEVKNEDELKYEVKDEVKDKIKEDEVKDEIKEDEVKDEIKEDEVKEDEVKMISND